MFFNFFEKKINNNHNLNENNFQKMILELEELLDYLDTQEEIDRDFLYNYLIGLITRLQIKEVVKEKRENEMDDTELKVKVISTKDINEEDLEKTLNTLLMDGWEILEITETKVYLTKNDDEKNELLVEKNG